MSKRTRVKSASKRARWGESKKEGDGARTRKKFSTTEGQYYSALGHAILTLLSATQSEGTADIPCEEDEKDANSAACLGGLGAL
eukprot:3805538-Rhodomonas_salina.1